MLTTFPVQNLGVPSHLIPAVIDAQKEATAAEAEAAAAKKNKVGTINLFKVHVPRTVQLQVANVALTSVCFMLHASVLLQSGVIFFVG